MERRRLLATVPNSLTIFRLICGPVFPFLPQNLWLPVVLLCLASEFLDGYLARMWNCESASGRMLDPVADKVFVGSVALTMVTRDILSLPLVLLVGLRDITVMCGWVWSFFHRQWSRYSDMKPLLSGKVATALQFFLIINLTATRQAWDPLLYATIAGSAVAALQYIRFYTGGTGRS